MKKIDAHQHWWWGENRQWFPKEEILIRLKFPPCIIRYNVSDALFATFEDFYQNIAEIEWIGAAPPKNEQLQIITEGWNFLAIEERILEDDYANIQIDEWKDEEDF